MCYNRGGLSASSCLAAPHEVVAVCLGEARSLRGSATAGTQVSLGMLWACLLPLGADALGVWEVDYDMLGTCRSVGVRMCNRKVAFQGFRGWVLLLHPSVIT